MKLLEILNMKGKRILTSKIHHDAVEEEEVRQPCDDNEHTTDDDDSSNSDFSSRSRSRSAMNVNLKANAIGNANGDTVVSQMAGDNGPIHTNGPNKDASGDGDGDGDTCAADQRSSPSKKIISILTGGGNLLIILAISRRTAIPDAPSFAPNMGVFLLSMSLSLSAIGLVSQ